MHPREQTIFALSSGRLPSAIAIVRVSGPQAGAALGLLAGKIPTPRMATRALLRDADGAPIDDAIVLWFPAPASATGEDVAEFHVHGGRAVVASLFAGLAALNGMRAAEPGEFTRRAFEHGKLDLTEAEGLDDLIQADTDRQRRQALRQLKGLLGDRARDWRARIIEASALIEAGIDFADEGDVPADLVTPAFAMIKMLLGEIREVLAAQGRSERLREGLMIAIAGPPNVGKSTLLNQLARREAAIVSPHAGTTRDIIEVQLDLEGYPVTLIDTAGIRQSDDPVEQEGVRRARARAAEADLVIWMIDAEPGVRRPEGTAPTWIVRNKIDVAQDGGAKSPRLVASQGEDAVDFEISAKRGDGLAQLVTGMIRFSQDFFGSGETALVGRTRQRELLQQAADSLQDCLIAKGSGEELIAEGLRRAAHSLGRLLGRVDVEDVLDLVFRNFCIGK